MGRAVVSAPITLGMLVMLFLCLSLQNLWRASFGPFLHWLANLGIGVHKFHVSFDVHPFRAAETINVEVQKVLSQGIAMAEKNFVRFLNYTVEPFLLIAGVTLALGLSAYEGFDALWHHVTKVAPRVIHQTIVRPVRNTVHVIDSRLSARVNTLTHRLTALGAHVAHLEHAIPHAISHPIPSLEALLRDRGRTRQRLHDIETKLTVLGFAGLMVAALGRMKLGWLRCPSLLRIGNKLGCGGFGWLEGFFATTFEALVVLDLCRFALGAQRLARLIVPQLAGTLLVQNAVCLGGGGSYPSAHDSPKTLTRVTLPSAHD